MSKGTDFVNRWMAAVIRGDLDGLVSMCEPNSVHANPDGTFRGAEAIRELFKPMIASLSNLEIQINNVVEAGDTVVVEFITRGLNDKPLITPQGTIPATQKAISLPEIAIYELRGDKLAGSRAIFDRLGLMAQLGLLPAPARAS
ncbi:MAG TPA: nuclear transport factor 2 family protein [Candidatus Dormibacteraeota bacterium]